MVTLRSTHHQEAITPPGYGALPVLIDASEKERDGMIPDPIRFVGHWNKPIRRVPEIALKTFVDPKLRANFEKRFDVISKRERARILYLLGLANAIDEKDSDALEQSLKAFERTFRVGTYFQNRARLNPTLELGEQLNICIRRTTFVIWWSDIDSRFLAGLYCKDLFTALAALALAKIGTPGGLSVCQRPLCGTVFIRSRSKQAYCSPQCQAAAAMTRYRAKLGKGEATKKRKKSRRTR